MAPLPAVPNVVKCNVHWNIDADTLGQTIHYFGYSGGAPSGADLENLADTMVSEGHTAFGSLCTPTVGMQAVMATDLSSDMGHQATGGTPWVGGADTGSLPPGAAAVVAHQIQRRYRGGKPRSYLPLGNSGFIATTGLWTTGFVSAVDTAWGDWVAAIVSDSPYGSLTITELVSVSFFSGYTLGPAAPGGYRKKIPTPRDTPQVNPVTGHTVSKVIGSQRRRNRDA